MLYAKDIKIDPTLMGALSGHGSPGTNAYNAIGANYDKARSQFGTDAKARGLRGSTAAGPGSYAGGRFDTAQNLDIGALEAALAGGLGNASYENQLQEREFNQNSELAREAAELNKPGLFEEILAGLGGAGKTAGTYYGMRGMSGGGGPQYPNPNNLRSYI